ncbi:leucine-rich repeat domain-containing protein [Chryseobacterium sp. BLS98]|uniref:leucine-rich repeat domain-containing protein n=1 Tax=Chryseobacterium sp. BLS98 TaxID=885586 RepID=UPI00065AE6DF|nr:leucine-rich repeat domain-containing protein [Chryseobacterium sp. BLS98]
MKTKEELRLLFENGDKPTQEDFWAFMDSYWHKDEKIDMIKVSGLENGTYTDIYAKTDAEGNTSMDFYNEKRVFIQSGTLRIPDYFTKGTFITELKIPEGVVSIGQSAFHSSGLTSLFIPDSVVEIKSLAFSGNVISSLRLSKNVSKVGYGAFSNNQLSELYIPTTLKIIDQSTFSNNKLTSVEIPNGVNEIKNFAFGSNQLSSVTISNSVLNIEAGAFSGNNLTQVILGPNTQYNINSFDPEVQIIGGTLIN